MDDYLSRFNKRMAFNGGTIRREKILNSRNLLTATFADDPSYRLGVYRWELGLSCKDDFISKKRETIKIRLYDRKYSTANGVQVKFQTLCYEQIQVGDIIFDSNEEEFLICTEAFNIDDIHWQGKFTLCNWMLKWQKPVTGEVLVYPCYNFNSTQYNSGETTNKQFTVSSSQHTILLPYDENTVVLNTPQRFILDRNTVKPVTFIITQNDTTSMFYGKKGVVRLTVVEYAGDTERDRPDLELCDYFDPIVTSTEIDDNKEINAVISYDTAVIKSGGDSQVFVGEFLDSDGNSVDGLSVNWEIVCDFLDHLEVSKSDNQIEISVDDDSLVDEEFRLILSDESGDHTTSLIVKIESLW